MPANNSKTNRSIRRTSALERFKVSPTGPLREGRTPEQKAAAAEGYKDRKAQELEALQKPTY